MVRGGFLEELARERRQACSSYLEAHHQGSTSCPRLCDLALSCSLQSLDLLMVVTLPGREATFQWCQLQASQEVPRL